MRSARQHGGWGRGARSSCRQGERGPPGHRGPAAGGTCGVCLAWSTCRRLRLGGAAWSRGTRHRMGEEVRKAWGGWVATAGRGRRAGGARGRPPGGGPALLGHGGGGCRGGGAGGAQTRVRGVEGRG